MVSGITSISCCILHRPSLKCLCKRAGICQDPCCAKISTAMEKNKIWIVMIRKMTLEKWISSDISCKVGSRHKTQNYHPIFQAEEQKLIETRKNLLSISIKRLGLMSGKLKAFWTEFLFFAALPSLLKPQDRSSSLALLLIYSCIVFLADTPLNKKKSIQKRRLVILEINCSFIIRLASVIFCTA